MKATLLHYPDTPMAELQIARSAFTGIIPVTLAIIFMTVHYGVCGASMAH